MKQIIRDYLTFNKRERNGIFVLLAIIFSLLIYLMVADKCFRQEKIDFTKFEKEIQLLQATAETTNTAIKYDATKKITAAASVVNSAPERFKFNPNQLPEADWKRLGLTDKQIHSIKNYESKGGTFRKKEDVKKMYCISMKLYASLEPYIEIPVSEKMQLSKTEYQKRSIPEIKILELNSADSLQLTNIKGIGAFYAKTIIKYRNALGGFHSKEQLMEVWKFNQEKYDALEKYITVDTSKIKRININTCSANELKHPYINWKIANGIINYRSKHGNFHTLEEIKETDLLNNETFLKIVPYLKITD
jgi:competence ComEA-like helix-hairpin-helix protein